MSASDLTLAETLDGLPRNGNGPVFAAPWEARAFAMTVRLASEGHFTWKEWTEALAHEIGHAAEHGECDDGSQYYRYWLAALEHLAAAKGLTNPVELEARTRAWIEAHHETPHGQPVELRRP